MRENRGVSMVRYTLEPLLLRMPRKKKKEDFLTDLEPTILE